MTFKPGDRVRSLSGKTGTVVSEPRRHNPAQGDAVSGVHVEVLLDEAPPGYGPVPFHVTTLNRLDGPDPVVMIDLEDDEVILALAEADPRRGAESVEQRAQRLQKQITHIVRRAVELDSTFRGFRRRVTLGQAIEVVEASGAPLGLSPWYLEQLRSMEVHIIVSSPENPE